MRAVSLPGSQPVASPAFPSYMEMPRRATPATWTAARTVSLAAFLGMCLGLVVRPAGGLFVFWRLLVPALPLLFFVAPGLWRNLCPLAAANQLPRRLGITRAGVSPGWLKRSGYTVAIVGFVTLVSARKLALEANGPATAAVLGGVIVASFVGGVLLRGKSGWCSSMCPLLPVQRLYGQTPFVTVPNSHCQPCVGCTKNCYDFNPSVAYQADMYDADLQWGAPRRFFAGAFPGLVIAFFTLPSLRVVAAEELGLRLGGAMALSAGLYFAAQAILGVSASMLAALFGAVALNAFYWYSTPGIAAAAGDVVGIDLGGLVWGLRVAVLTLTLVWLVRTRLVERRFLGEVIGAQRAHLAPARVQSLAEQTISRRLPEVRFLPDDHRVPAAAGTSILEAAEAGGLSLEAGCRMGLCGSDPVAVLQGAERLSPIEEGEANTLRRLGLAPNTRLACSARLRGDVCVSLVAERGGPSPPDLAVRRADPAIRSVVVLGNGIAGVTAADFVRRENPDCEIHVVGREAHRLYNRMAISRLIHGRSAMQGLYLLPEDWYDDHNVTCWLNTRARLLDVTRRRVTLGTGEELSYDRLILATGSSSTVPDIAGFHLPGSFVVRDAEDAIAIRAYVQEHGVTRATVLGGGPLGLEAAHALRELGLAVAVVERNLRLLHRQIDETCSDYLARHFSSLGIAVLCGAAPVEVAGDGRVRRVVLEDHTTLDSEIVVACAGIRPNADLARRAGLAVNRGVVVDDTMLTSAPGVFAAGDVAECDGQVLGLWPVAVEQAQVAGVNATGGGRRHAFSLPAAILKGVGVDVVAAGRIEPRPGDEVICIDDPAAPSYAKLVMSNGRVVGGLSFGRPLDGAAVLAAVRRSADVTDVVPVLREGNFEALASCAAAGNDQSANPAPRPPAAGWTERRPSAHDGRGRSRFDWSLPLGGKLRGHDPR